MFRSCPAPVLHRFAAPPFWLLALLAGLLAFRLGALWLARSELFFDEAQYWFWSLQPAAGYYSKPPLIGWIIAGATALCGDGEACVRAASPLLHTLTAFAVYGLGQALYGRAAGAWAALAFATLPGVSFSAGLISTDVPLLLAWAVACLALIRLREGWGWAVALGIALGAGLLAKYAMAYFAMGLVAWWAAGGRLPLARLALALAIAALCIAPNIAWNAANGFATLQHTADNASGGAAKGGLGPALGFVGGQFGIMGLLLPLAALAGWHGRRDPRARFLLAFSLPVLALMLGQAALARAHANWAAVAYVPLTVLVAGMAVEAGRQRRLRGLIAAHAVLVPLLAAGHALAGRLPLPSKADPFTRVLGWRAVAQAAAAAAREAGTGIIATDKRALAAELSYYLRGTGLDVRAVRDAGPPRDHYELTRPLTQDVAGPVLLVTMDNPGNDVPEGFSLRPLGERRVAAGSGERSVFLSLLVPKPR